MCGDMRLNGDLMTYENPANTDLIDLWERRRGLPVTLGLVYIEVARRCGLQVQGVDFPGHFLLRIDTAEGPLALDPFSEGRVVLPSELTRRALLAGLLPHVAERLEVLMAPAAERAVLIRLQNNIFARASQARDYAPRRALGAAPRPARSLRPPALAGRRRRARGPEALAGALQALGRAQVLDGGATIAARAARRTGAATAELIAGRWISGVAVTGNHPW